MVVHSFVRGVTEQATVNEAKARSILELYEKIKIQVVELTHSQHSIRAVDYLFNSPVFSTTTSHCSV